MKKRWALLFAFTLVGIGLLAIFSPTSIRASDKDTVDARLRSSGEAMKEILNVPDDIPQDLLDKADCVVVLPSVLKAAFVFGGSYGRGAMTCRSGRHFRGPWSAPTMMVLEGGSFGFQIGGEATDFVLLIMNAEGARSLLSSKVKLGAGASAAAGPVGRAAEANTDAYMRAEILSYSRARGVFAGISLNGATLHPDVEANQLLYGRRITARKIVLRGAVPVPTAAAPLINVLIQHSPKNLSK